MSSRRITFLILGLVAASSGCLYDSADRCGHDQELDEHDLCQCVDGRALVGGECEPCEGEHEVASGGACGCEEGFVRDGQGVCTDEENVVGTWPTGQGEPCDVSDDCAGQQATYCETFFIHQCLVEGCALEGAAPCSEGWLCCDFTDLAGVSVCIDQTLLEGGTCPAL